MSAITDFARESCVRPSWHLNVYLSLVLACTNYIQCSPGSFQWRHVSLDSHLSCSHQGNLLLLQGKLCYPFFCNLSCTPRSSQKTWIISYKREKKWLMVFELDFCIVVFQYLLHSHSSYRGPYQNLSLALQYLNKTKVSNGSSSLMAEHMMEVKYNGETTCTSWIRLWSSYL